MIEKEVFSFYKDIIREIPFFNQLFIFDLSGSPIVGYPQGNIVVFRISSEEQAAIQLALNGVLVQSYVIPPNPGTYRNDRIHRCNSR
jgi:hypothetical protein